MKYLIVFALACFTSHSAFAVRAPQCIINAVPGKSLGPIKLGITFKELKNIIQSGKESKVGERTFIYSGLYNIELFKDIVTEIWINNISDQSVCKYHINGKPFLPTSKVQELHKRYGPCKTDHLEGETRISCKNNTLEFGYGIKNELQLRIKK